MVQYDVIVIGAGPSGMAAALSARKHGASVLLLEKNDRVGKKILSTGNGRCNLTNASMGPEYYYGSNHAFLDRLMCDREREKLLEFLEEIGIMTTEKNGYYYPASMQAATVREGLETALHVNGVDLKTEIVISSVSPIENSYYKVSTNSGEFISKSVIFALGGLAAPKLGSDGSGFPLVEGLGLSIQDFVPGLVAMTAEDSFCKKLAGIRAEGVLTLKVDKVPVKIEHGEIQLTDYGISGIPTFCLSRIATTSLKRGKKVEIVADFMPNQTTEEILQFLKAKYAFYTGSAKYFGYECTFGDFANGLVNHKLASTVAEICRLNFAQSLSTVSQDHIIYFVETLKCLTFHITGSKGFDAAQVSVGGVSTKYLSEHLESLDHPGVFVVGELVDVDGVCGGYNLQWAFTSGFLAGNKAGSRAERNFSKVL